MERKLPSSVSSRLCHVHLSPHLFTLFLVLRQIGQHILHVVQACGSPSKIISPIHSAIQDTSNSPRESSILLHKAIKICHEFINRLSHVHMSGLDPNLIRIRNSRNFVFVYTTG